MHKGMGKRQSLGDFAAFVDSISVCHGGNGHAVSVVEGNQICLGFMDDLFIVPEQIEATGRRIGTDGQRFARLEDRSIGEDKHFASLIGEKVPS